MGKIDDAIDCKIEVYLQDKFEPYLVDNYVRLDTVKEIVTEIVTDTINDMMVEDICALSTLENHERYTYEEIDKLKGRIYDLENPPTVWVSVKNIVSRLFVARKTL